MTVENKTSKTDKLVMGSSTYDFGFDVLLEDPTEEDAKEAILCVVSDGLTETELKYGVDYNVSLDKDGKGGTVTVTDPKDENHTIIIYRRYNETQGSDYRDTDSFPAETLEGNLDKITMILQQHTEEIGRSVKVGMQSNVDPEILISHVERVYESIGNIDIVANDKKNLDIAAENINYIKTVSSSISNVNTSAQNINKINIVANNISYVAVCSNNIDDIIDAKNQATIAYNSALSAESSAAHAAASALSAQEDAKEIRETLELLSYDEIMGGFSGDTVSDELVGGESGDNVVDEYIGGTF